MRVISGKKRGLLLYSPETEGTRPTTDRVKENIFNIIQFNILNKNVLDLFAGSGAMGIEALSRGAKKCTFVDNSNSAFNTISKNIKKSEFDSSSILRKTDFLSFLKNCNDVFDIVFLDPPYHNGYVDKALAIISEKNLINEKGLIVIECDYDELIKIPDDFSVLKERLYGRVKIIVLERH